MDKWESPDELLNAMDRVHITTVEIYGKEIDIPWKELDEDESPDIKSSKRITDMNSMEQMDYFLKKGKKRIWRMIEKGQEEIEPDFKFTREQFFSLKPRIRETIMGAISDARVELQEDL